MGRRPEDRFRARLDAAVRHVEPVGFDHADGRFERPTTWDELFAVLARFPDARLLAGATDLGLDITKRHAKWPCLVSLKNFKKCLSKTSFL